MQKMWGHKTGELFMPITAYPVKKTWVDMPCPICESDNTRQYCSLGIFNLNAIECLDCGFKEKL